MNTCITCNFVNCFTESIIQCENCSKVFSSKSGFKAHFMRVHIGKRYVCGTCGKKFASKHSYERHFDSHGGTPPECAIHFDVEPPFVPVNEEDDYIQEQKNKIHHIENKIKLVQTEVVELRNKLKRRSSRKPKRRTK